MWIPSVTNSPNFFLRTPPVSALFLTFLVAIPTITNAMSFIVTSIKSASDFLLHLNLLAVQSKEEGVWGKNDYALLLTPYFPWGEDVVSMWS